MPPRSCPRPLAVLAIVAVPAAALAGPFEPYFRPLTDLSGGLDFSQAFGISADGTTVVGRGSPLNAAQATRWLTPTAPQGLAPGVLNRQEARGVSADGSVIVGGGGFQAFRWTAATGAVDLPTGVGVTGTQTFGARVANAVSANGLAVVGRGFDGSPTLGFGYNNEAFLWTAAGGTQRLGDLAGGSVRSEAYGVSGDGGIVIGDAENLANSSQAFRWTPAGGMVGLGYLNPGPANVGQGSRARAITPDGRVIVGESTSGNNVIQPFLYTEAGGMVGLGAIGTARHSTALAVSADGLVVAGRYRPFGGPAERAFIWDGVNGNQDLQDLLASRGLAPDLAGWQLREANSVTVTPEGVPIVAGWGIDPSGNTRGFVAAVPEPATMLALSVGALALLRRRRKA